MEVWKNVVKQIFWHHCGTDYWIANWNIRKEQGD
jgi:hypothetical protein